MHLHSKAPSFSSHKERGGRKFTITTLKREHPPTDLQSAGRAKLRERVRRPQPLRLRPGPRCRHTLLGVLPAQHGEEHAVAPREALDLRHGWLVGASPDGSQTRETPPLQICLTPSWNKPCDTETGSGIPQNPTKSAAKPHESERATLPGRDFAAESVAAQLESTAGRGRQAADSIRGRRGRIGRVKCARTHGASASPRRFAEIAHTNAKANPTAEAIKKKRPSRCGGGGESAHAPIPIEPNTQQKQPTNHTKRNPDESERKSLFKNPKKKNGNSSGRIRQAGLLPLPALPRNNPASQRGANFGTVRARPGRGVKIGFFDGRGEGGREILADFSCSDFCPAPAHPLVITRIACCILSP